MDGTRVSPTIVSAGSATSSNPNKNNSSSSNSSSSSNNPYTVRLKTKPINAEEGDTLSDLFDASEVFDPSRPTPVEDL